MCYIIPGMKTNEVFLGKSNIDMLVSYMEALSPPAAPTNMTSTEAYTAGFTYARSSARRLVLDMWAAAEIATAAAALDLDDDEGGSCD